MIYSVVAVFIATRFFCMCYRFLTERERVRDTATTDLIHSA